jgi:hypothetical protein
VAVRGHDSKACTSNACYEVTSFVKPGAVMDAILNTARDEIRKLRSEDVVVIWGGANDASKNNTKVALKHVCNFVKSSSCLKRGVRHVACSLILQVKLVRPSLPRSS